MTLEELRAEQLRIESIPLFAEYREHEFAVPFPERFSRIAESRKNVIQRINDHDRLTLAHNAAKANANGQQGAVETGAQR